MASRRRRSLLVDDELYEIGSKDESSSSDVCERCGCTREEHEKGASAGKKRKPCEEFVE